ncbi:serine hydrolase domain-containing protein [Woodsholea maritima]|uniref:serine hydrolase domain-containing protein n=1 Tax=Woodsholea maritima TaxID=240237 RepID=UPI00036411F0|nr:serine hydrolase [Woodsholea maritima]
MKKLLLAGIGLVAIGAGVMAGWYYRPWSPYSPARIAELDNEDRYFELFQEMDEVLPSRPIAAANPEPFARDLRPLIVNYDWQGGQKPLEAYLDEAHVMGLSVLKDGVVIHQTFRLGADENTRMTSWSVAKSFVATLIAEAMTEGKIGSLDDLAQTYAPQYQGTDYGNTSLRHLLMMSAGMDFIEDYTDDAPRSDIRPLFFNAFIMGKNVDEMIGAIKRNREPGQDLHYTSPNSHVLAAVVRGVYGKSLPDIVEDKLWAPLGMESDATWLTNRNDDQGLAIGYCCLQATSADFARFGQLYLQDGVWNGQRLLPEGWVDQATRANAPFQAAGPDAVYAPRGYGLHFWFPPEADQEFSAEGVFGQYIWVDQRRGVVIAINAGDPDYWNRKDETIAVMRAIVSAVAPEQVEDEGDIESPAP